MRSNTPSSARAAAGRRGRIPPAGARKGEERSARKSGAAAAAGQAAMPSARRQLPATPASQPTSSGAAVDTNEEITLASEMATARCSPCWSARAEGMMVRISEPTRPIRKAAPMVTNGLRPATRSSAPRAQPGRADPQGPPAPNPPDHEMPAQPDQQDTERKGRVVQAADRIIQAELIFQKGGDRPQDIEEIGDKRPGTGKPTR